MTTPPAELEAGNPFRIAALSILALLIALATAGVVGVVENARLKDAARKAIAYDGAVSSLGDDIRVSALDLRFHHRTIVDSGPSDRVISQFDGTYLDLLAEIDALQELGVADLNIPQPDELREVATSYHDGFRPSIALFTSDPIAFNDAAALGLQRLDSLIEMAEEINDVGESLTTRSLAQVELAADRERWILVAVLVGVGLIGILLLVSLTRIVQRLQSANATEQAARLELAVALRMKTDFIADASHELRTPITLIRGNAELSLATAENEDQREALREIHAESTRMSRLVNDLLLLARSDAGTLPLDLEYLPIGWLAVRLEGPARTITEQAGLEFALTTSGNGHALIDPDRLEQAVLILLDNAARYSTAGDTVSLAISATGGTLQIAVTDNGPGIPPEEQARIFDRFYQVRDNARRRGGAGIGLAIARSIAQAHGGTISVSSEIGRGAAFRITIPLAEERNPD